MPNCIRGGASSGGPKSIDVLQRMWAPFAIVSVVDIEYRDSIAKGEYPKEAPPRPAGVERNLVVSLWDWGPTNGYIHDTAAGDRRNPTVNANGPVFGASQTHDVLYWVDPVKNTEGSGDFKSLRPRR